MSANFLRASETLALGLCFCPLTLQQLPESETAPGGVCSPHFPAGVAGEALPLPKPGQGAVAPAGMDPARREVGAACPGSRHGAVVGPGCCRIDPSASVLPGGGGRLACRQLTGVRKVKLTLLNKKWENSFLSLLRRWSRGACCRASCWSGGSASPAGSARGIAVGLGFGVQTGCSPWSRVTSAICVPSPFSLREVSSVLNQVSDLISQRSFKWGEIGVLISAPLSTCSQV